MPLNDQASRDLDYPDGHRLRHEWDALYKSRSPSETHSCDHWHFQRCMCAGACACHWRVGMIPADVSHYGPERTIP